MLVIVIVRIYRYYNHNTRSHVFLARFPFLVHGPTEPNPMEIETLHTDLGLGIGGPMFYEDSLEMLSNQLEAPMFGT